MNTRSRAFLPLVRLLLLSPLLFRLPSAASDETAEEAWTAYRARKYSEAFHLAQPAADHGDVVREMLAFDVDVFNWLFGLPEKVWGAGKQSHGVFDHVHVGLRYGDVLVAAEASVLLPRGSTFATTLRLICEGGLIELDFLLPKDAPVEMWFAETRSGGRQTAIEVEPIDPDVAQIRAFKAAVEAGPQGDNVIAQSARDTLDVCLELDAALRA